jgi:hypothetical protein
MISVIDCKKKFSNLQRIYNINKMTCASNAECKYVVILTPYIKADCDHLVWIICDLSVIQLSKKYSYYATTTVIINRMQFM